MQMKKISVGPFQASSYLLWHEDEALFIDAGAEFEKLKAEIPPSVRVSKILLTHAHLDHMGAVRECVEFFSECEILLHEGDHDIYKIYPQQCARFGFKSRDPLPVTRFIQDRQKIAFAGEEIEVIHTPGHSPGGCCFYLKEQGWLFTGDTLFAGTIGRTDLWGGEFRTIGDRHSHAFIYPT